MDGFSYNYCGEPDEVKINTDQLKLLHDLLVKASSETEISKLIESKKEVNHRGELCLVQNLIDQKPTGDTCSEPFVLEGPLFPDLPLVNPDTVFPPADNFAIYTYRKNHPFSLVGTPTTCFGLSSNEWDELTEALKNHINHEKHTIIEAGSGTGYASAMLSIRGFKVKPVDYRKTLYDQRIDNGYFMPFTECDLREVDTSFFHNNDVLFFCFPGPQQFQGHVINTYLRSGAENKVIIYFYGKGSDYNLGSKKPEVGEFMSLKNCQCIYKKKLGENKNWEVYKYSPPAPISS